jgi:phage-related protein
MAEVIEIDINAKDNTAGATKSVLTKFQTLGRDLGGIGSSMSNIFTRPLMDLGRFITKNKEVQDAMIPITQKFTEVGDKLALAFVPVIERLTPALLGLADLLIKIIDWFSGLPPGIQDFTVVFLGIVAAIGPALLVIGQLITGFGIVSAFFTTGAGAGFATAVAGVFGAITLPILALIGAIALLGVTIYVFGEDAWNTVLTIGKIFQALWELIKIKIEEIKTAFTSVDWGGIGRNMMEGVVNGIQAGWNWVVNAASNVAEAAFEAARNALWSHSPSVKFEILGKNMMQGLANGIDLNAGKAISSTSKAVSATVPAAATSASSGGGGGTPFVYAPMISLANESEAERVLLPMLRKLQRSM